MRVSRNLTNIANRLFDDWLPPVLRESRLFYWLFMKPLLKEQAGEFATFKERAPYLSPKEIREVYAKTAKVHLDRPTDLNPQCLAAILAAVRGGSVVDIGCGRGFLAARMAELHPTTGLDFSIDPGVAVAHPGIAFVAGELERLPFGDAAFDTVVCSHTLEHVLDLRAAIAELRRVARRRLLVVVPLQRRYRLTFDLHLQFFPTPGSFLIAIGGGRGSFEHRVLGGDLFYQESYEPPLDREDA